MSNLFRGEKYDVLRGAGWTRDQSKLEITGKLDHTHLHGQTKLDLTLLEKEEKEQLLEFVRKATKQKTTID